jgi:Flp pilus assembly protein TadG
MRHIEKVERMTQTRRKVRGAVIVEFALLLIPLLMIVAGIIEFGRTFWYYDALTKATRDGARFLSMSRASPTVALDTTLEQQAKNLVANTAIAANVPNFSADDVEVVCDPDCDTPNYITVNIDAYPVTIGGWIPVFVPTSATTPTAATTAGWGGTLSPYTTMRYMR